MVLLGIDYSWVLLPIWFRRYWFAGFVEFPCLLIWVAFDIASSFDFSENYYNWEKSLVCGRLYQLFRPFFWIDWRWYVSFVVFLCLLVWVGFWHWLLCDFSECHYNWEDIGFGRLYQLFRPYFLDWLTLVCDFCCFSVSQSLRGFWHWLFLWFLWVPLQLRGHWFGGRVCTLSPLFPSS
jgi:hypothetical protein